MALPLVKTCFRGDPFSSNLSVLYCHRVSGERKERGRDVAFLQPEAGPGRGPWIQAAPRLGLLLPFSL